MNKVLRFALTGSALATGMLLSASPAQADCVVTPPATPVAGSVVCGTTITTDTTYLGVSPSLHRNYNVDTSTTAFTGTVSTGAAITGAGLAFTNTVPGTNAMTITNNGSVTLGAAGAVSGGNAALDVSAAGATNIVYTGTGSVTNSSATGAGLQLDTVGTGNLTATVGGNTYAIGFPAVFLSNNGTGGNISLTTSTGTTSQSNFVAIVGQNFGTHAGTVSVTNNSAITSATGTNTMLGGVFGGTSGTGAVTVVNNGAVGTAADRTQTYGVNGTITNAASTAALGVSGTGAVFTSGTGVLANNSGTGATTVNYTGAVNSTGANGVVVTATTGAATVTTGAVTAATNAVSVTSSGTQTINLNGVTTGTAGSGLVSTTTGTRTITVGTAGNVTGATQAISLAGTGATTLQNNGTIGAASTSLAVNNTGTGAVTLTNGSSSTSAATLNGRLTLNAGNDSVTNLDVWNTQGTTDFGAGTDTLTNGAGGVINLAASTTFANLETFNQTGTINFAAGTVLTGPAIAFTNGIGGLIDTAGAATIAGFTSMTNSGTLNLAAGTLTVPTGAFTNTAFGVIIADEGASTITGQTSFTNAGTITLQDGAIGDNLTINSAYTGAPGARLQVDVSGTTADILTLPSAGGQTFIDVSTVGLGVFDPDGILVVDVTGAAGSADAFVIGEQTGNPLINYDVQQVGADFFLVTLLDPETAFVPLAATGLIREMWYQSADEVFAQTLAPTVIEGFTIWGEVYGSQRRTGMTNNQVVNGVQYDADNNIEIDRYGVQAGVGFGWGMAEIGLTGGYANAQADGDGEFDADGWNIGLYGKYGGLTGFHAEALFKHDNYNVEFDGLFDGNDVDASSTGIDGSLGYRMALGVVPSIDVFAGLSHVWSDMDGVSAFGFDYDFDDMTSTRGRLGVRGNFGGLYNPYLSATGYHEFSGDGDVTITQGLFSDSLSSTGKATWVRLEGGLAGGPGTLGVNVAGWVDLGDVRGAGIRAGFRWGGARAMAEPAYVQPAPPPPPMAAPPPATQTCADGSVILATEACPPPPPPPAPGERGL